ncbi:hypothetical protein LY56_02521 [Roseinatronobacter thiooxidans]|uniref:Uncharacterized protein n=1 Tax=Roseinatronobacter thiooxidans TaxID=121821 RepID=A0A2W7PWX1_9RHOB|nr:hypothetical protein [Roseinatronobacter thiooxidans]PZX40638.1 hypothetical protein LY56_02521 [Roseinatronobacter thiooxidans]
MAHFAEIDDNSILIRVLVVPENQAERGAAFLRDDMGLGGQWVPTSYTGRIARRFAGPGMRWDAALGAFLLPQPFPSWSLDTEGEWHPPVPRPEGDGWDWDEAASGWVERAW